MDIPLLTSATIGLLGSAHCAGMCGGIVGAISSGRRQAGEKPLRSVLPYHLTYNAGRIVSYSVAGAIVGFLGSQSTKISPQVAVPAGELIAGVFMIALGFYLTGWQRAIAWLENLGRHLWKYVQPLGARFLPVRSPAHAFGVGLVWGWLPCGLVYSALALALVSASTADGALLMVAFGLGTLPALLAMGGAYDALQAFVRSPAVRTTAGVAIMLLGAYTSVSAMLGTSRHHGQAPGEHSAIKHHGERTVQPSRHG
jgi:hypothetical protein